MKIRFLGLLLSLVICLSFTVKKDLDLPNQINKPNSKIVKEVEKIFPPIIENSISVDEAAKTRPYFGVGIGTGCNLKIIIKGCGNGFKVFLYSNITGEPYVGSISYQVYSMDWAIADYGFVEHNENTSWVLEPCTEYRVLFFSPECPTAPIMVTAITDGCGGIFIC